MCGDQFDQFFRHLKCPKGRHQCLEVKHETCFAALLEDNKRQEHYNGPRRAHLPREAQPTRLIHVQIEAFRHFGRDREYIDILRDYF